MKRRSVLFRPGMADITILEIVITLIICLAGFGVGALVSWGVNR